MIIHTEGDIIRSPHHVLVNTVNCKGVMGAGLALGFAKKYPTLVAPYQKACRTEELVPGGLFIWTAPDGRRIVNFATKGDWRHKSQYAWIKSGLHELADFLTSDPHLFVATVALPRLGCGLGGLDWRFVSEMVEDILGPVPQDIWVYTHVKGGK
jgi:O-acetyl-ADP-ribose deacetylase (regulator of RNase III)